MSGFVQVSVDAESITDAMNEDVGFALDVWREIASGLHKGLLLDNACDLIAALPEDEATYIIQQFEFFCACARDRRDMQSPSEDSGGHNDNP